MKFGIPKAIGFILFAAATFATGSYAQRSSNCANMEGYYHGGPYTFDIRQSGCSIRSSYLIGDFDHYFDISFRGNVGRGYIYRTNIRNRCRTVIEVNARLLDYYTLEIVSVSSDGRCDLPRNWYERAILSR